MRESLTIFAGAVILLLTALLVGPYLVDWNGQRDWLAARLSEAAGAQVRIAGPIDVKLLPRPIFRAGQVTMAGRTAQDPHLSAASLDAELSINGLLRGAVEFVDARVSSPSLDVTLRSDGSVVTPSWDVENPQKVQFTRLILANGTVTVKDEAGASRLVLRGIDAQGEAETLFGPWKINGGADGPEGRFTFRVNTGAYGSRKLRARISTDGPGGVTHAEADGIVTIGAAAPGDHAALSFAGSGALTGSVHVADGAAPVPWRLVATEVRADATSLAAAALELRGGTDGRAVVANGSASLAWGRIPSATMLFHARQLDLDRLTVPPEVAPDTPRPRAAQWLAFLQTLAGEGASLPVRLSVAATVDAVTVGAQTFTDLSLAVDASQGGPPRVRFALAGPDGSRVTLDGSLAPTAAAGFTGRAEAATRNLSTLAGWIDPVWPGAADWAARVAPGRAMTFRGAVDLSPAVASTHDMTLTIDDASLTGSASLTAGTANERPRLFADLTADSLDGDVLPDLGSLAAALAPVDLSLGFASDAVTLGSRAASLAGRLAFHLTKRGGDVTLDPFTLTGVEGATMSATAVLDGARHLKATGRVDTKNVGPLIELVRRLSPGRWTDGIVARAPALSPLDLAFNLDGTFDDTATLVPTRATGSGRAGGTSFTVAVVPAAGQGNADAPVTATVRLDAPDAAALLAQWGLPTIHDLPPGPAQVQVSAKGTTEQGFETTLTAIVAGSQVTFDGIATSASGRGRARGSGPTLAPVLGAAGFAMPMPALPWTAEADLSWADGSLRLDGLTGRVAERKIGGALAYRLGPVEGNAVTAPVLTGSLVVDNGSLSDLANLALAPDGTGPSGSTGWSGRKFRAVASWPRSEVALRFDKLDLVPGLTARDAELTLKLAPASVTLADGGGRLLDGRAGGTVTIRRDGGTASVSGQIKLDALVLALPSLAGRLSVAGSIAGTGTTPDNLLGSLAGDATLALKNASVARLDPGALLRVAKTTERDGSTVDDTTVRGLLDAELDRARLPLDDVTVPATLAAGTLRVAGVKADGPDRSVTVEGAFDLRTSRLNLRTTLATTESPKDWKGDPPQVAVTWSGPLSTPERNVDAAAFVNGLAARAIAREQERIELLQDDLRERAFFARRLRQIEAEQQAVRDATQALKVVPQPPRPGDIRLPRLPDPAPLNLAPGKADDLTKFIDALKTSPLPPLPAMVRPIEIAPKPRTSDRTVPNANVADPATTGQY